jgi:DNA-binding CsgD family transcriptional regulator
MGPALGYSGAVDEAIPVMEEGLRLAVEAGAIDEVLRAYVNLGETLDLAGRMDDAVRMALDGWRTAQRERMRSEAALLASEAVLRLLRLGRWDEAAAVLDEAVAEGVAGVTGAALVQADAELAALRGEPRATQRMAEAERLLGQPGSRMWTAPLSATSAALALWTGRPEDARALIERELALKSVDETDASGFVVPLLALGARAEADLAVAARALGDETAASDAVARAGRCQGHLAEYMGGAGPEVQAHAATCVAEVARAAGHDTPDHWAAVAAAWDGLPRPFQAACARWREAAAALDAGDGRPRAETPLRAAAATAREIGAAPLLAEVEALARRARIDLGPAAGGDGGAGDSPAVRVGLTPRELEVLRLVAAGHTNREIGAELFISEKTASVHLSRILTKLGARGRVEAAGLAHRLGLLDDAAA